MRKTILFGILLLVVMGVSVEAAGNDAEALFAAARAGEAKEVAKLIESGVPVDSTDKYGATALAMAASSGHFEVVRVLLEQGADPNNKESFYGSSPLVGALFSGVGDRVEEMVTLLLENGCDDRESAFGWAIQQGNAELAAVAVDSGPLYESMLARFRAGAQEMDPELKAILDRAQSRPDPPAPKYTASDLEPFLGRYEGFASGAAAAVTAEGDRLLVSLDGGEPQVLTTTGDKAFEADGGKVVANFFGRAGTIEGIQLAREGEAPSRMRRSVAEPLGATAFTGAKTEESVGRTVNWPGFRGRHAAGIGDGVDTAVEWSLETGESVVWNVEVPGLGNSSPVVWGDTIFVTTATAEREQPGLRTGLTGAGDAVDESFEHRWTALAYDKRTGERLWETVVGSAVPLTKRHFKATQANSTPATDGKHLVVVFPTAGLACLGLDGEIHWKKELGGLNAGAFTDPGIEWGYASSPIIYGSSVIQQVDVHGGAYIAAWDLETGRELWRTERDVAPSWATPNVLSGPDGDELVVNGSTIHGYDPASGRELWSLAPNSELVIATPVVSQGKVYVSAGYPPVKPIYALEAGLRGSHEVDPRAGDESLVWSHGIGGAYMPTPLLYQGLFYVVHHNGRLVAYDAATGAAIYKKRFSEGGTFTGSPVAANGKLYMGTEEGHLYVLRAGTEFEELAVNDLKEPLMATPAISEGTIFLRTPSRLVAIANPAPEEAAPGR